MDIVISTGNSRLARVWKVEHYTADSLCERLREPIRTAETADQYAALPKTDRDKIKDHGGFVGGKLRGARRLANAMEYRSLITLDLDDCPEGYLQTLLSRLHYDSFIYSTHSHTPAAPRFRLLVFLARNISPDEYNAITHYLAHEIGAEHVDPCSFRVHQLMYWPSAPSDGEYVAVRNPGPALNPTEFLAAHPNWRDLSDLPQAEREQASLTTEKKTAADPYEKNNIVGLFCRAHGSIENVISAYLSDVYCPSTTVPGRYDYIPGSSTAGAVVIDGKWLFSHHATDPAGGHMQNGFDLVRIHLFGEKDKTYSGPIDQSPSYKAMTELAKDDQVVLAKEREERAAMLLEDFGVKQDAEWETSLIYNKKGGLAPDIVNAVLILANRPELQGIVFNEFADNLELRDTIPWHHKQFWRDTDDSQLNFFISSHYGPLPKQVIRDAVDKVADDRSYHPIKDFLAALPEWDGVPRLDSFLIDMFGAEDSLYTRTVTRKTFTAAIARIMKPGCKWDYLLALIGPQGVGKSSTIAKLCGQQYFSDSLAFSQMKDKASAENIQGSWIIEIGEMAGVTKSEEETVKAFLSRTDDKYRASYGHRSESHYRQCIFIGTGNHENGFLRDITGNRRYWPVIVPQRKKFELTEDYILQFWAEAKYRYEEGEELFLDSEMEKIAEMKQTAALVHDDREGIVEKYLETLIPENWEEMDLFARREFLSGDNPTQAQGTVKRTQVSNIEIWCECFGRRKEDLHPKDSYAVAAIMKHFPEWQRGNIVSLPIYGRQRVYTRSPQS